MPAARIHTQVVKLFLEVKVSMGSRSEILARDQLCVPGTVPSPGGYIQLYVRHGASPCIDAGPYPRPGQSEALGAERSEFCQAR